MILQRLCRPLSRQQSFLRGASAPSKCFSPVAHQSLQARSIHQVPLLRENDRLASEGITGLYSPEGFETAWLRYQEWLVWKLNARVAETPEEHMDTKSLLLWSARDPSNASLFNLASMAWNNHFFFNGLTARADPPVASTELTKRIEEAFTSMENFRDEILGTASSMFGPGFVWLVIQDKAKFRLLTTYIAGSPLPGAHWRQQPRDLNTENASSIGGLSAQHTQFQGGAGSFGPYSLAERDAPKRAPGGADIVPVLCVNTWQHAYMRDFNVDGKDLYLERWWDRIDWSVVEQNSAFFLDRQFRS